MKPGAAQWTLILCGAALIICSFFNFSSPNGIISNICDVCYCLLISNIETYGDLLNQRAAPCAAGNVGFFQHSIRRIKAPVVRMKQNNNNKKKTLSGFLYQRRTKCCKPGSHLNRFLILIFEFFNKFFSFRAARDYKRLKSRLSRRFTKRVLNRAINNTRRGPLKFTRFNKAAFSYGVRSHLCMWHNNIVFQILPLFRYIFLNWVFCKYYWRVNMFRMKKQNFIFKWNKPPNPQLIEQIYQTPIVVKQNSNITIRHNRLHLNDVILRVPYGRFIQCDYFPFLFSLGKFITLLEIDSYLCSIVDWVIWILVFICDAFTRR